MIARVGQLTVPALFLVSPARIASVVRQDCAESRGCTNGFGQTADPRAAVCRNRLLQLVRVAPLPFRTAFLHLVAESLGCEGGWEACITVKRDEVIVEADLLLGFGSKTETAIEPEVAQVFALKVEDGPADLKCCTRALW